MTLYGEFTAMDGRDYRVDIITKTGDGTREITLGPNPFVSRAGGSDGLVYEPVRGGGATVEILTESWLPEIYSADPLGTRITLTETTGGINSLKWSGFATPCTYDQEFDECREYLTVEAADGLAVLSNLKFSRQRTGTEKTFAELVDQCLSLPGIFRTWYVSDVTEIYGASGKSAMEAAMIYDSNFFEEKEGDGLTDLDKAWTARDVLEEICRYLSLTAVAEGDSVRLVDYDAVKRGRNSYWKFNVGTPRNAGRETAARAFAMTADNVAEGGTRIGLDAVYDSVSVRDEFHTVDLDALAAKKSRNITRSSDAYAKSLEKHYHDNMGHSGMWPGKAESATLYLCDTFNPESLDGSNRAFQCIVTGAWKQRALGMIIQFWRNDDIHLKNYQYDRSLAPVDLSNECGWGDLQRYHGAYYVKAYIKEIDWNKDFVERMYDGTLNGRPVAGYRDSWSDKEKLDWWNRTLGVECQKVELTPYILMVNKFQTNGEQGHIGPSGRLRTGSYEEISDAHGNGDQLEDCQRYPFLEYDFDDSGFYFGAEGAYMLISGQMCVHDEDKTPVPISDGGDNGKLGRDVDKKWLHQFYQYAKLKAGNNWWDGGGWVDSDTQFKIYWHDGCDDTGGLVQNQTFFDKWFPLQNITKGGWGATEEGYRISADRTKVVSGAMTLTLYCPKDMFGRSNHGNWKIKNQWDDNRYSRYYSSVVILRDFAVEAKMSNGKMDDKGVDSDTVYTNCIVGQGVNPLDEIVFKITTFDEKSTSYSTPAYEAGGGRELVKWLTNSALDAEIAGGSTGWEGGTRLRAEEYCVWRVVSQYEVPRVVYERHLEGTDFSFHWTYMDSIVTGKTFVAVEIEKDWAAGGTRVRTIEKN